MDGEYTESKCACQSIVATHGLKSMSNCYITKYEKHLSSDFYFWNLQPDKSNIGNAVPNRVLNNEIRYCENKSRYQKMCIYYLQKLFQRRISEFLQTLINVFQETNPSRDNPVGKMVSQAKQTNAEGSMGKQGPLLLAMKTPLQVYGVLYHLHIKRKKFYKSRINDSVFN